MNRYILPTKFIILLETCSSALCSMENERKCIDFIYGSDLLSANSLSPFHSTSFFFFFLVFFSLFRSFSFKSLLFLPSNGKRLAKFEMLIDRHTDSGIDYTIKSTQQHRRKMHSKLNFYSSVIATLNTKEMTK